MKNNGSIQILMCVCIFVFPSNTCFYKIEDKSVYTINNVLKVFALMSFLTDSHMCKIFIILWSKSINHAFLPLFYYLYIQAFFIYTYNSSKEF